MFLVECKKRDKVTLEALIIANVEDGSTIFTDGWSSYHKVEDLQYFLETYLSVLFSFLHSPICRNVPIPNYSNYFQLEECGHNYKWDYVNHSTNFVKPGDRNVHTNTVESNWYRCVNITTQQTVSLINYNF